MTKREPGLILSLVFSFFVLKENLLSAVSSIQKFFYDLTEN
ncbi:hypothetical protein H175_8p05 (plasmid) [Bacillus thuringiensis serovar thuringiensis str. IS5056]|nr:hypothetical protein H175_8p05 [Bacillus thuringiensis serovar thuringiensis str. IS5056]